MNMRRLIKTNIVVGVLLSITTGQSLIVVVNNENKIDDLSLRDLKNIYLAEKQRWDGRKKIELVMLDPRLDEGNKFLQVVYDMSLREYNKFWLQKVFQGEAKAPNNFDSSAEVISFVSSSYGAIGFIKKEELDDKIKVISIDGKHAGDQNYLFGE